jgi:hypothetical protein
MVTVVHRSGDDLRRVGHNGLERDLREVEHVGAAGWLWDDR